MSDPVDQVLRLVAQGRLTAKEAAPILDALDARRQAPDGDAWSAATEPGSAVDDAPARYARVEVVEAGRKAVDLRIPLSLGRLAVSSIPGLSGEHAANIQEAISSGIKGPILDVQDADGDGVRIVIE
jgi:hypothetical protein